MKYSPVKGTSNEKNIFRRRYELYTRDRYKVRNLHGSNILYCKSSDCYRICFVSFRFRGERRIFRRRTNLVFMIMLILFSVVTCFARNVVMFCTHGPIFQKRTFYRRKLESRGVKLPIVKILQEIQFEKI